MYTRSIGVPRSKPKSRLTGTVVARSPRSTRPSPGRRRVPEQRERRSPEPGGAVRRREGEGADGLAERRRREFVLPPAVLDRPHHLAGVVARPYAPPLPPGRLERRIAGGVGALPLVDLQDPAQHGSRVGRHVGAVPAVEGGQPGMRRDRVLSGDAEVGVVVLAARQRRIEASGGDRAPPGRT